MFISVLFITGKLGTRRLPFRARKPLAQLSGGWALEAGHLRAWGKHVEIHGQCCTF